MSAIATGEGCECPVVISCVASPPSTTATSRRSEAPATRSFAPERLPARPAAAVVDIGLDRGRHPSAMTIPVNLLYYIIHCITVNLQLWRGTCRVGDPAAGSTR